MSRTREKATFEATVEWFNGTEKRLRVQRSKIKNNTYEEDLALRLKEKNGNRAAAEGALKKLDWIRWLTEGDFTSWRPCSMDTQIWYGLKKFEKLDAVLPMEEMMWLDNVFFQTEGRFCEENMPRQLKDECERM